MVRQLKQIAVLGASGRLGRAVVQALGPHRVVGFGHSTPHPQVARWLAGDRRDAVALQQALAGVVGIVDLCGFEGADGQALVTAAMAVGGDQLPLIVASSLAERTPELWARPETELGPLPRDAYGAGKRALSDHCLAHWRGPCLIALLPQLLIADDPEERALAYLATGQRTSVAVAGSGQQRPATVAACDVAHLFARWLERPQPSGRVQISHPQPLPLTDLVAALLIGAGQNLPIQPGATRGPHSGGDETLDLGQQARLWPDYPWLPLTEEFASLGRGWRDRIRGRSAD